MNREDFDSPPINWVVISCTVLLFSVVGVFLLAEPAIVAAYHPNAPTSPWIEAFIVICFSSIVVNTLLAIFAAALRKKAPKRLAKIANSTYLCFLAYSVVLLISAKFAIPDTVVHSVGNTRYDVPSKFLNSRDGIDEGLALRMCVEDLTGLYNKREKDCDIGTVTLFELPPNQSIVGRAYSNFFEEIDEFDVEGNRVVFNEGSDKYKVLSQNGLDAYTVDELWLSKDTEDSNSSLRNYNIPTYFEVDNQAKLTRFVGCSQVGESKDRECTYFVSTDVGMLKYPLPVPSGSNLPQGEDKEEELIALISQWKVR